MLYSPFSLFGCWIYSILNFFVVVCFNQGLNVIYSLVWSLDVINLLICFSYRLLVKFRLLIRRLQQSGSLFTLVDRSDNLSAFCMIYCFLQCLIHNICCFFLLLLGQSSTSRDYLTLLSLILTLLFYLLILWDTFSIWTVILGLSLYDMSGYLSFFKGLFCAQIFVSLHVSIQILNCAFR